MVRISDARMSGTAFGTVVLHVAPESAAGGPLGAVRDGDTIVLDVEARRIDLDVPAAEIERRLAERRRRAPAYARGYGALYLEHVLQADEGCDFDFLRARAGRAGRARAARAAQRLGRGLVSSSITLPRGPSAPSARVSAANAVGVVRRAAKRWVTISPGWIAPALSSSTTLAQAAEV